MAEYFYRCTTPGCGNVIRRQRTFAEQAAAIERERDPRWTPLCKKCFGYSKRIFTAPNFIIRPSGWNLRPEDPAYGDFNRELELGEVRGPSAETRLHTLDEDEMPASPLPTPDYEALRELHQAGEVLDRAIRERDDLPEYHGEGD